MSRILDSNDNFESALVDNKGNEYEEAYALAWRYLGMYIDCDVDDYVTDDEDSGDSGSQDQDRNRMLGGDDDNDSCSRKILWAAYVDPRYQGGSIGEYQYYDWYTDTWDTSSCQNGRCARMDCHEPQTHYKLVGVYKETDGLYDWAEQLFKHQGYCVWQNQWQSTDVYDDMETYLENWYIGCASLYLPDDDGNTLYLGTQPGGEGNMTYGIYADEYCTQVSETTSFSEYVVMYYYDYYGGTEEGEEAASTWESRFDTWNTNLNSFKVCQPCRAYDLGKYSSNNNNNGRERGRSLKEENDGAGDNEQWGYDCNDAAGYLNCNQCYKFETHTDMEPAYKDDLKRASKQGTILRIKVNGKFYGEGGFHAYDKGDVWQEPIFIAFSVSLLLVGFFYLIFAYLFKRRQSKMLREPLQPSGPKIELSAVEPQSKFIRLRDV